MGTSLRVEWLKYCATAWSASLSSRVRTATDSTANVAATPGFEPGFRRRPAGADFSGRQAVPGLRNVGRQGRGCKQLLHALPGLCRERRILQPHLDEELAHLLGLLQPSAHNVLRDHFRPKATRLRHLGADALFLANHMLAALMPAMQDVQGRRVFLVDERVARLRHGIFARAGDGAGLAHARILFEEASRAVDASLDQPRTLRAVLRDMQQALAQFADRGLRSVKQLGAT